MPADPSLLALAAKSSETDLAFLLRAKEEAKKRMKDNPSPDNIRAFNQAKDAVEAEAAKAQGGPSRTFATQLAAVDFLKAQGFKVGKSKFNADVKKGLIPAGPDGSFEAAALLGYAAARLKPLAAAENTAGAKAMNARQAADAELKQVQADRFRLKLQKEQGLLMPRADHEADLSLRAQFFKAEIEGFIHHKAGELIALVGGDEAKLQDLIRWWEEQAAEWMDAWSQDREFNTPDEPGDEDAPAAEAAPQEA